MRATSIHLFSRTSYDPETGRQAYCGTFYVECPDGDQRIDDLERVNAGRWQYTDDDGITRVYRSYFFADEIDAMCDRARRETECDVELDWSLESRPTPTVTERVVTQFGVAIRERCAVCGGLNPGDITHTRCSHPA